MNINEICNQIVMKESYLYESASDYKKVKDELSSYDIEYESGKMDKNGISISNVDFDYSDNAKGDMNKPIKIKDLNSGKTFELKSVGFIQGGERIKNSVYKYTNKKFKLKLNRETKTIDIYMI